MTFEAHQRTLLERIAHVQDADVLVKLSEALDVLLNPTTNLLLSPSENEVLRQGRREIGLGLSVSESDFWTAVDSGISDGLAERKADGSQA